MSLHDANPFIELGGCGFRTEDIQIVFPLPPMRDDPNGQRCRIYTRTSDQHIDITEAYDAVMNKLESWYRGADRTMRKLEPGEATVEYPWENS